MISIPRPSFEEFRMKLRIKFKFHGPPLLSLHHFTALAESDSIVNLHCDNLSLPLEIFIARWIARTSALLISMVGIEVENKHLKFPLISLKTPPIADLGKEVLSEASTFHFRDPFGGVANHTVCVLVERAWW